MAMDEELQRLLQASPTSAGAFGGGQIPLGFDANAIYQYQQRIQNPNAAPAVPPPQEAPTPQAIREAYKESVYPEVWNRPTPPVEIIFPKEFNPSNPTHVAAAEQAYNKAYDPGFIAEAALDYLNKADSQQARINSGKRRVSELQGQLAQLEKISKDRPSTVAPTEQGDVIPMSPKKFAENEIRIRKIKKELSTEESDLSEALQPVVPKPVNVVLPAEQPQQPEQVARQERLPEAKPEVPLISPQRKKYNMFVDRLNRQASDFLAAGAPPSVVQAEYKRALDKLDSTWTPENVEIDGITYSYPTPNKIEKVRDNVDLFKERFNNATERISKNIENIDELDAMRKTAIEASKLTGEARAARIQALINSLKAVNTAISGTSDALAQNEFNRIGAPLEAWNLFKALQPDSIAKFGKTNPEGFAKSIEALINIVGGRLVGHYKEAEKISDKFPVLRTALPEKPSYYGGILKTLGKGDVIQKGQSQQQQAPAATTKGGTRYERR